MDRPQPLIVAAPGKVNLSLIVGPRRADGYHDLFTVFYPLALADRLTFRLEARAPGDPVPVLRVLCPGVAQRDNLVTRALRALEEASGWRLGGEVLIEKRLPVAGGVGGGSSDAAQALLAGARALAQAGAPAPETAMLHVLAAQLGADVPFFLDPRPALARGLGERLEPLPLPPLPLVLVANDAGLSTAAVYRAHDEATSDEAADFDDRSARAERAWRELSSAWTAHALEEGAMTARAAALLENDLESAAVRLLPELTSTARALKEAGALAVRVSGSGPTLFGVFPTTASAGEASVRLRARGLTALVDRAGPAADR